jgi:murein DD-endopeptidase MepM/ murein hydrolase activator NlpD
MTRPLWKWFASLTLLLSLAALARPAAAQDRTLSPSPSTPARVVAPKAIASPRLSRQHADALDPVAQKPPTLIALQSLPKLLNVPAVQVGIEPLEGGAIVYHPVAGKTFYDAASAQVSLLLAIKNQAGKTLTLEKVRLEYAGGSKELPASMSVANNDTLWWQNSRDYHEVGDVLYLAAPIPNSLTIKLYFTGYSAPASVTKPLKPYARAFALPFKQKDLRSGEVWEGGSTHGGGSQVFAYDVGVYGYDKNWDWRLPGKSGAKNEDYRVWGKPIYAMADGVVAEALNDCPNNPKPAEDDAAMAAQKTNYWGSYTNGGSGNHLYIQHGDVIALYAHMQKGTIPAALRTKGAVVKKGDLLGYAGNSGNSSGPHLHVHIRKETVPETGPFRPLLWNEGFAIYKTSYTAPKANVAWSQLAPGQAFPGYEGDRSFIWPSAKHPYCEYATGGGEISRHGLSAASFQEEFDKVWTCGYYPIWIDGYSVGGKTFFNLVVRPDDGKPWVARNDLSGTAYQAEFDKWGQAGYRLIFVDSYLKGGAVNYAAVWRKDGGPQIAAYHGVSAAQHQSKFDEWTKSGWVPVNVSVVGVGNDARVTALYEKTNPGGFYARHAMTPDEYQSYFTQYGNEGFKLVYVNGYSLGGKPMLSAIWYKNTAFGGYIARHALTAAQYQTEYSTQLGSGFTTRSVTAYESGGSARFAGLWTK